MAGTQQIEKSKQDQIRKLWKDKANYTIVEIGKIAGVSHSTVRTYLAGLRSPGDKKRMSMRMGRKSCGEGVSAKDIRTRYNPQEAKSVLRSRKSIDKVPGQVDLQQMIADTLRAELISSGVIQIDPPKQVASNSGIIDRLKKLFKPAK